MADFVTEIARGEPAILVGTQLLAKGHHFPDVTLVAMLDMDSGFYSTDFRATERVGQMIVQVAGRAGRAEKPGHVIIQTSIANNPYMAALLDQNFADFSARILQERERYQLPPFSYHCLIRAEAIERSAPMAFLTDLKNRASAPLEFCQISGPFPAIMERRAGRYRAQLLISSSARSNLHRTINSIIKAADDSQLKRKVRWSLDVDPVDLY